MKIKHIEPYSTIKVIFLIILVFVISFFLYHGVLASLILVAFIFPLLLRVGLEIDLKRKKYRKIVSFLGINIGIWRPLPKIEYVSVFKTIKSSRIRSRTAETTHGFIVYKVNLFYFHNKHLEIYISDEKEDAFKLAIKISKSLNIEFFDATKK